MQICTNSDLKMQNSRKFEEKLRSIGLAEHLRDSPLRCMAFITAIHDTRIRLMYPFFKKSSNSEGLSEVTYLTLSPCSQPRLDSSSSSGNGGGIKVDENECFGKCGLNWSLQIFDKGKMDRCNEEVNRGN